jgi:hypothetical protein
MGMLVVINDWGVFQDKKRNVKILKENPVPSTFHQTLGAPFSRTIT